MPDFELRGGVTLRAVSKRLKEASNGKELRKELNHDLREGLRKLVKPLRAAYLANPGYAGKYSRSRAKQPPLRELLAKAVRVEVRLSGRRAGARIRVDGRRLPSGMRGLASAYEGETRWRHPVFADRDVWVAERSRPTFRRVVGPHAEELHAAAEEATWRVLQKIERAT